MHKTLLIAAATHLSVSTQSATRCGKGLEWRRGWSRRSVARGSRGVQGEQSCSSGHRAWQTYCQ